MVWGSPGILLAGDRMTAFTRPLFLQVGNSLSCRTEIDLPIPPTAGRGGFLGTDSDRFAVPCPFGRPTGISAVFFCAVFFFFIDIIPPLSFFPSRKCITRSFLCTGNLFPGMHRHTGNTGLVKELDVPGQSVVLILGK